MGCFPCKCTRPCSPIQLATAHHHANRRWNNKKPTQALRTSFPRQHEGTCDVLRQHFHTGCSRQRHVLLFFGRLSDERLLHHRPALCRRLHRGQRPNRIRTTQADHNCHSGGQLGIHHAYPRNVD